MLNGTQVSVNEFPQRALDLYLTANQSSPNRAINTLGTARAYSQLLNNIEAVKYYKILLAQINSSNNSDPGFAKEALDFIALQQEKPPIPIVNIANNIEYCILLIFIISIYLFSH